MRRSAKTAAGHLTYPAWQGGRITAAIRHDSGRLSFVGRTPEDEQRGWGGCQMTDADARDIFGRAEVAEATRVLVPEACDNSFCRT